MYEREPMSTDFEELAYRRTAFGELSLRRRRELKTGTDIYEIKLGDEFLMSSRFNEGERALAELALAPLGDGPLDVVVGGLGLGYTARAVLDKPGVRSLLVIEALADVIDWHRRGFVPLGAELTADRRCDFVNGDFFGLLDSEGLDSRAPDRRFSAILVDIDHSPRHLLHPAHAALYRVAGLRQLASHLQPGGVFGLWSNDEPDADFRAALAAVFSDHEAHRITFCSLQQDGTAQNTVYVARKRADA
jgi:spermidine synthase